MGVDALMRGCVDAMQESPAATIPVLFSAPLKGEPRIVVALRAFFMPAEPARRFASIIKWEGYESGGLPILCRAQHKRACERLQQDSSPQATPLTDQRSGIGAI